MNLIRDRIDLKASIFPNNNNNTLILFVANFNDNSTKKCGKKIRETQYSESSIISRVSGVKFSEEQDFTSMKNLWNGLVDQVAFVEYNPWENSYGKQSNTIDTPCSDLWRRMFVWWDGKTNPCDVDYKSLLSVGKYPNKTLKQLWQSKSYNVLRERHLTKKRSSIKPCSSCVVI